MDTHNNKLTLFFLIIYVLIEYGVMCTCIDYPDIIINHSVISILFIITKLFKTSNK